MFSAKSSRGSKKRSVPPTPPIITQSLAVPIVSYSSSGGGSASVQPVSNPASAPLLSSTTNEKPAGNSANATSINIIEEPSARIEPNRRRRRSFLANSRLSLYSLFYPSVAYSNRKPPLPAISRSVNDIKTPSVSASAAAPTATPALGSGGATEGLLERQTSTIELDLTSTSGASASVTLSGERVAALDDSHSTTSASRECPLCCVRQHAEIFPPLKSCAHRSCRSCLRQYLQTEILESRVNIACPECSESMHPNDIHTLLSNYKNLLDKYEEFSVRRVLMTDPDTRWCPAPDCTYGVIATGCAGCPEIKCERPGCHTLFCYHCKMTWHPNQTCNEARAHRGSFAQNIGPFETTIKKGDVKPCPRCLAPIVKADDGSCNHMICSMCGAEFCWLCMREISDLHYLSPSGCTFWAKKPWSRKKKLIWQLGMLVGAPVGIALVAGFAVPAIMLGLPVFVGRKVHARMKNSSKTKRRFAVTFSVAGTVLMGPALAAMAVGVGVPVMLAYVYGVVPLSLCRNGSCGVTASPSGVRLDIDSDLFEINDNTDGLSHEKTQLLTNVDRSDVITITSARSGSTLHTQNKIQVHAEMAYPMKRRPSIESGAISLGDRQNYEDASVKALGGSVYYDDKSVHTMGSLAEGGSYCEDHASTKALAGSVICPSTVAYHNNYALPHSDSKSVCSAGARSSSLAEHSSHRSSECRSSIGGVRFAAFTTATTWRQSMTRLSSSTDVAVDDSSALCANDENEPTGLVSSSGETSATKAATATLEQAEKSEVASADAKTASLTVEEFTTALKFADQISVDSVEGAVSVAMLTRRASTSFLETGGGNELVRMKNRSPAPYSTSSSCRLASIGESSTLSPNKINKDFNMIISDPPIDVSLVRFGRNRKSQSWSNHLDAVDEPLIGGKVNKRIQFNIVNNSKDGNIGANNSNSKYYKKRNLVDLVARQRQQIGVRYGRSPKSVVNTSYSSLPEMTDFDRLQQVSITSSSSCKETDQPLSILVNQSGFQKKKQRNSLAATINNFLFKKTTN